MGLHGAVHSVEEPVPVTGEVRSVVVGGQQLRVAVRPGGATAGDRPPLLLINGIGVSLEMLGPLVRELDPDVEVIMFDPPGIGGSALPRGPYRCTGLCRLIAGMLTELGYNRVDVLGISWGGGVAQHFAAFWRSRCPSAGPGRDGNRRADGVGQAMGPGAHGGTAAAPDGAPVPVPGGGRGVWRVGVPAAGAGGGSDARRRLARLPAGVPVSAGRRGGLDQPAVPACDPGIVSTPARPAVMEPTVSQPAGDGLDQHHG